MLIPGVVAVFSRGAWVTLTAIFVFSTSSGSTIRAARDRLLGIFIGTAYAFIALLIIRYVLEEGQTSQVAISVFVTSFAVICLVLMDPGLSGAAIYAAILMLYSLPPDVSTHASIILANFLNTFIGAILVTLLSGYSFLMCK